MKIAALRAVQVNMAGRSILYVPELALHEGKRYAVVGPSGSGKSTFLRVLNLLEDPKEGELSLFGQAITEKLPAKRLLDIRRQMVYVSQKPVLFAMNVADNIRLGLTFRGLKRKQDASDIEEVLSTVGLGGYANRSIATLSGGEAQRVALARALILRPRLLLLDEATANLDPANIEIIETAVKLLQQRTSMTVIMVTHNLQQARRMGEETIFIHNGMIREMQPNESFFTDPQTTELADFLSGRMIY
jgi:tungstate transport system ATP-binding protein